MNRPGPGGAKGTGPGRLRWSAARDLDPWPVRATTELNAAVRAAASETNADLADAERRFAEVARRRAGRATAFFSIIATPTALASACSPGFFSRPWAGSK